MVKLQHHRDAKHGHTILSVVKRQ